MQFRSIKGFTGWAQLGILLVFIGFGIVLAGFVQLYFGMKALGLHTFPSASDGEKILTALLQPQNATYAQLSQIFSTLLLLFIPSLLFIVVCYNSLLWAGFSKYFNLYQIIIAFLIILVANYFASPFEAISKSLFAHFPYWDKLAKQAEELYNKEITAMSTLNTLPQLFGAVFIIAFLPALFEEFFFRGVLQNLLVRWLKKPILAITIASVIFSLIHASYYLFISRFVLGYILGLLFYQSKNIWVNTFAHFMNNFLAILMLFVANNSKNIKPTTAAVTDPQLPIWSLLLTGVILFLLFKQFRKISTGKKEQITSLEILESEKNNLFTVNDIDTIGNN